MMGIHSRRQKMSTMASRLESLQEGRKDLKESLSLEADEAATAEAPVGNEAA